jgi:PAS domain S-box-containing protein
MLALLPPIAALLVRLLLGDFIEPHVWFLFYPALFISFWIGGLGPGLLATIVSIALVWWFLVSPPDAMTNLLPSSVFLFMGALFAIFHNRLQRANQQALGALDRFASIFQQAPDGIFVADLDGHYTGVNAAGCRMLGYTHQDLIGKTIFDLIPPEDVERLLQSKTQLLHGDTHVDQWTLRRSDGVWLPVEVSAKILPDGRWQGFVRDISERKRLERALQKSHADLERAQTVANIGSWSLDVHHNELQWSDEAYRIFGVPLGTPLTYETFLACVHPDDRACVDREWNAALNGAPYDIVHRVVADGRTKWVREKADLEYDEHGAVQGGVGITEDITERKHLEDQLRESQERLELALKGASLATWDWNIKTGEVIFNSRWAEMRGFRLEQIRPHVDSWASGVHPDDMAHVQKLLLDHFQGLTAEYSGEHRVLTASGEWLWILDLGRVCARNERGEPIRMVGVEFDIGERKRLEAELRLAEAKSSGIVSIAADAIISIDEDQRITMFNNGAESIFGHTKEEAIGEPLEILIPERFRAHHRRYVQGFAASPETARRMGERSTGIVGLRQNGEEFPADAAISRLQVGGKLILTVALRDVTEQRRIEHEQTFLAEVGSVLASTLDYEETIKNIARLLTRDLADVCIVETVGDPAHARRLFVAHRDADKAAVVHHLQEIQLDRRLPCLGSSVFETQTSLLISDVTPGYLDLIVESDEHRKVVRELDAKSLIALPLMVHGRIVGSLVLIRTTAGARAYTRDDVRAAEDVALRAALAVENAHLYETAQRAIQARDEVLGVVAHDLRNPLGTILMQAALLQRRGGSRDAVGVIERAGSRMNRLIQDLLDVTSMEAGILFIEPGLLSTKQVISEVLEAQMPLVTAAYLELQVDLAVELPDVWADGDRLRQVFENLIGNATKFTDPGGHITVGAVPRDAELLFWVADTGAGIPGEEVPHLFDRFWQARKARRRGVGLGLAIVKGIVEAHGGRVWVESTLGAGSTFFFTIPLAPRGPVM